MIVALLPWAAYAALADDAANGISLFYLGAQPALERPALRVGDECFIAVSEAPKLGWVVTMSGNTASVKVGDAVVRTFVRELSGGRFIPLRAIVDSAGGVSEWSSPKVIGVFSRVEKIVVGKDRIEVRCTMPITRRVLVLNDPPRVVVDLVGARIMPLEPPSISGELRYSQFSPDTVRVVAQVDKLPQVDAGPLASKSIIAKWTGAVSVKPTPLPTPMPLVPTVLKALRIEQVSQDESVIRAPFEGQMPGKFSINRDSQGVHWIDFPSGRVDNNSNDVQPVSNDIVKEASLVMKPSGGCALRMELARPVGIRVAAEQGEIVIRLVKPLHTGGLISEKRIVIDAGHGGRDPGASWGVGPNAVVEKELTLSIARLVSEKLTVAGATVVMTRNDDTFIELTDRAAMATASSAHFFISIHINSNTVPDSTSGTFTYYRADDPNSRALAECIQAEVVKAAGLPDHGARSDSTVYPSGFVVLRRTDMPAVLLEVAYINHSTDRELLKTQEFRQKVAEGVVKGIQKYIGNQSQNPAMPKDNHR